MLHLPNNCRAGTFSVFPSNWEKSSADIKLKWRISFWFFDDNLLKKKKVVIKGMNTVNTLKEKQRETQLALDEVRTRLEVKGYNYFSGKEFITSINTVSKYTPLLDALNYSFKNIRGEIQTKADIKSCLTFITASIKTLHYDRLPVGDIKRQHVKLILEGCEKITHYTNAKGEVKEKRWSDNLYNYHRAHFSLLFTPLVDMDAIESNPVTAVKKRRKLKKMREVLTLEQRDKITDHLINNHYTFWRFIRIFFHASCREVELLRVRKNDVNLTTQKFKVIVKKGGQYQEELKTIKNSILPLWEELFNMAKNDEFIFSRKLLPGLNKGKPIRREQITKRWNVHVKKKLGITADLYSLKHSNLDEIAARRGIRAAQLAAGHTTPIITLNSYAVGEKDREHEYLKTMDNKF